MERISVGDKLYKAVGATYDFQINEYEVIEVENRDGYVYCDIKCLSNGDNRCCTMCSDCSKLTCKCKVLVRKSRSNEGYEFVSMLNNWRGNEIDHWEHDKTYVHQTNSGITSHFHTTKYGTVKEFLGHRIKKNDEKIKYFKDNFINEIEEDTKKTRQKIEEYRGV